MTAIEQLKAILNEQYITEDEDEYTVELKPGLTEKQIDQLATQLPTGKIPGDIRELLKFSGGFGFSGMDITFDDVNQFGFDNIFPNSVQLAGDGFGNFWILDVDSMGNWGTVFYVCHDPTVVVRHSENLAEFIKHIDEFGKLGSKSNLDIIHEKTVMSIWRKDNGFIEVGEARNSNDATLRNFAEQLSSNFVIADLRNKKNGSGFAWGKFGPGIDKAIRHETELLWSLEKGKEKGWLSRLFGK
jgi:cell wall assembly regulator SMI1